jgi:hypothetical protein
MIYVIDMNTVIFFWIASFRYTPFAMTLYRLINALPSLRAERSNPEIIVITKIKQITVQTNKSVNQIK